MSFRLKTILGIAAIQVILLVVLILSSVNLLRTSNLEALQNYAKSTAGIFATTIKDALIGSDMATIEELSKQLSASEGVAYVRVLDVDGIVVAENGYQQYLDRPFRFDQDIRMVSDGSFDIFAEVSEGGSLFGKIEVGFSTVFMDALLIRAQTWLGSIGGTGIILTTLFSLLLGIYLTKQLASLQRGAKKLAAGEVGFEVAVTGRDEIADTAIAFNEMSRHLKELYTKIQVSENRLKTIFDAAADGIVMIDKDGVILTVNPATSIIFGYEQGELEGRNVKELMPSPYRENHDQYIANYIQRGETKVLGRRRETEGQRRDGSTFPVELMTTEMSIGQQRLFLGIVRDITEKKKIDRMKSEFVSTVSHELRTPLTSIKGALGLLESGVIEELSEKSHGLVSVAHKNAERLINLVNDILDFEKLRSDTITFDLKRLDISKLLEEAVIINQGFAEQHEVTFSSVDLTPGLTVLGDDDRLIQVVSNLLSNAAKFSPTGTNVEISAGRRGHRVRISVSDCGPGIPKEFRDHIFDRFTQADASDTRQKGGTGLGLSIAKAIIEKHGGTIGFESKHGVGTTFYFDLPELGTSKEENPPHTNLVA
jgi:PAS domain S-box-containing protein